jgi:hypothetical protein
VQLLCNYLLRQPVNKERYYSFDRCRGRFNNWVLKVLSNSDYSISRFRGTSRSCVTVQIRRTRRKTCPSHTDCPVFVLRSYLATSVMDLLFLTRPHVIQIKQHEYNVTDSSQNLLTWIQMLRRREIREEAIYLLQTSLHLSFAMDRLVLLEENYKRWIRGRVNSISVCKKSTAIIKKNFDIQKLSAILWFVNGRLFTNKYRSSYENKALSLYRIFHINVNYLDFF